MSTVSSGTMQNGATGIEPPLAILAELTHRCPLQCPYCSNPVALDRTKAELDSETWCSVIDQAAELGALQIHFSGGEPTARKDLEQLISRARDAGLYSNLITAGVLLDPDRLAALQAAGLDHLQLSFQDSEAAGGDRIGGYKGGHVKKLEVARWVRAAGLPLTLNLVVHRQNLDHLDSMLAMAADLDAHRVEVAHVQYYGWAYRNRAALMPTRRQLDAANGRRRDRPRDLQGPLYDRLRGAGLLRPPAESLHGRLGPALSQHIALGPGAAMPCRGIDSRAHLRFGPGQEPGRDLGPLRGFPALPRHRLDG